MLAPFIRYNINSDIARRAGNLIYLYRKRMKISLPDALIVATAEYYHLALVSRNFKHFDMLKEDGVIDLIEY